MDTTDPLALKHASQANRKRRFAMKGRAGAGTTKNFSPIFADPVFEQFSANFEGPISTPTSQR